MGTIELGRGGEDVVFRTRSWEFGGVSGWGEEEEWERARRMALERWRECGGEGGLSASSLLSFSGLVLPSSFDPPPGREIVRGWFLLFVLLWLMLLVCGSLVMVVAVVAVGGGSIGSVWETGVYLIRLQDGVCVLKGNLRLQHFER